MLRKRQTLIKFGLNALLWKEEDLFVAKAVEVEVASQGRTKKEAIANLEEALELYFEDRKTKVSAYRNLELVKLESDSGRLYA